MPQLIHWLLTGATVIAMLVTVVFAIAQSNVLRRSLVRTRAAAEQITAVVREFQNVPERIDALERGQEIMTERHHAHIGRHGALVARVNKLERGIVDEPPPDGDTKEAERRALESQLAGRVRG